MRREADAKQPSLAELLFNPRTIALIGASGDPKKYTSRPQRFLRQYGYAGKILPVNPGRDEVLGEKAWPSILDVPGEIDHAFIMVPTDAVEAALVQCVEKKVAVVTIYSDGFAETGTAGRVKQDQLVAIAKKGGVRLIGPNCIGLFSSVPSCALSVNAVLEKLHVTPGPLAIISQSGSMMGGLLSRGLGRGVGFSKLVSVGNECDLSVGEIAESLVDDPHTEAILLFMETIRGAEHLARAARAAHAAGKPVIVYKLGRSEVGQDLAASHTGAMAGDDAVADAYFRAHGILRVDTLENLFELPPLLRGQRPASRHRVAVMTTTGGGAASVVDRLGSFGIDVVAPTPAVINGLAQQNIRISATRLTDLTLAGTKKEIYSGVLNALLASDHCDLVLAVSGSSSQFQPEVSVQPLIEAECHGKPLAVFLAPHAEASLKRLAEHQVAAFRTPEACADAIRAWRNWQPPAAIPPAETARLNTAGALLKTMPGRTVNEYDACRVFGALGIAPAPSEVITEPAQKTTVGFPVVAKILSPDILHKTDAGGVALNIGNANRLASTAKQMLERIGKSHPQARLNGILVQRMEKGLAEVILGFRHDPQAGPVVVLGVGGILAEIYKDVAIRLAPVDLDTARGMVDEVRGLAVIRGYRGLPRGDCEALAQAVAALSQLACLPERSVAEAEINPLIVRADGRGVVAVDGLIVFVDDGRSQ